MSALQQAKLISLFLFGVPALVWIAYLLIKSKKNMNTSLFEQEAHFIKNLDTATGKPLETWFGLIIRSNLSNFLDIRSWLVTIHQLSTQTATTIARLYLEDVEKNAPKVTFSQEGRSGNYTYRSKEGSFSSWWEFAGGNALAILNVPSEENWEARTGIPLSNRPAVLDFIGRETVRQQTTGGRGRFEVEGDFITIFS